MINKYKGENKVNVLVLNGSPKMKSDTMCITNAFLEGLSEQKDCDIRIRHIINMDIKACRGCFGCWRGDDAKCVLKDDMNIILEDLVWADLTIWSFPLYCYGMPSHLKAVLDRTLPLAKLAMVERDGRTYHEGKIDSSKKKYFMISGCGFPNANDNFEGMITQFQIFYGKNAQVLYVTESPLLNQKEAEIVTKPKLEQVKEAGRQYYKTGRVSDGLLEEIAKPMIPNKDYINQINSVQL